MRLGVLFSGGKDSCFACYRAMKEHKVVCLITVLSANEESYMFHTPNIALTKMQAEAMGIPIVFENTEGEKEKELADLKNAMKKAKRIHNIQGIVTGAIASEYQRSRIKKICDELDLKCINPLWDEDQISLLRGAVSAGFKFIITGVFAYPLGKELLGREIDSELIEELGKLQQRYRISPSGEGGEIETFVMDGPIFRKRILIEKASISYSDYSGVYRIEKAKLSGK